MGLSAVASALGTQQFEAGMGIGGLGNLFFLDTSTDNITAKAGGGQTNATQLVAQNNRVTTVATAGDSVRLPPAVAGLDMIVINHGANPMQVYGSGTDTINDVATATGVPQMQNSSVLYFCMTNGVWYTEGLASGFVSGGGAFQTYSTQTGITAHAGGGRASAVAITAMQAQISTVATTADSVVLPPALPGMEITIVNNGANSAQVFGNGSDTINGTAGSTGVAQAAAAVTIYYCFVSGAWITK